MRQRKKNEIKRVFTVGRKNFDYLGKRNVFRKNRANGYLSKPYFIFIFIFIYILFYRDPFFFLSFFLGSGSLTRASSVSRGGYWSVKSRWPTSRPLTFWRYSHLTDFLSFGSDLNDCLWFCRLVKLSLLFQAESGAAPVEKMEFKCHYLEPIKKSRPNIQPLMYN